jgi:hypothetical protein
MAGSIIGLFWVDLEPWDHGEPFEDFFDRDSKKQVLTFFVDLGGDSDSESFFD